ncbi:MAG: flagellar motor switch protein FliN [Bryobacteraceae bacterium]
MTPSSPYDPDSGVKPPDFCEPVAQNGGTMDLLMDMELPIMVRFGSARMLLRDLLKLTAGSIVEFNRSPENPVEVLVNGRVVARGSAIVVEGNYGVRISEIAPAREAWSTGSALHAAPGEGREN